jgi:nitrate/TMAO reductase-like tetraheme cytochrome c subunit
VSDAKPKGPRATPGPHPVRPKKLFERPWPWLVIAGLIVGAVFALGTSLLQSAQDAGGSSDDAFFAIAIVGVIAVVLMLLVGFYSARKRRRGLQEHMPGTMMVWLKGHVWIGLAALLAVLVHAWLYPITSDITTGKITLAILIVLVLSGIAWRIVYQTVPKRVPGSVGNLSVKDTRSRLEQIQVELEKTMAGGSDELRRLTQLRLEGKTKLADLDRQAAALAIEEQATWEEVKRLADRRDRYRGREPKQERYHHLLQRWKLLHLPLAVILGAAIAIHVMDVLGVDKKVFADEADAFPSSQQCANCHTDIVQEWMLAVHSVAQESPITVAQTALALKEYPGFEAVCTNCHAPIGNQVSHSTTFPLPGESHGDAVLSEGITCWACHSVAKEPTEVRGAFPHFPVGHAGARSFGTVFNPKIQGEPPLPVPDHQAETGFMTSQQQTFQLCGACHDVKVDINGDGELSQFPGSGSDDSTDSNGDGILDQNEQQIAPDGKGADVDGGDVNADLVLQTTFDEWQDYLAQPDSPGETCADCHMLQGNGPIVNDAPGGLSLPDRPTHSHTFVGVDYDLEPDHYSGLGVGGSDALKQVLDERHALVARGVGLETKVADVDAQTLTAEVTVFTKDIGHAFPTGFAFARQWWLEVSATTADGDEVCLAPVIPGAGGQFVTGQGGIVTRGCSSGHISSPAEDLRPCDPVELGERFPGTLESTVNLIQPAPLSDCDPWLTNFQKILTDGDPDHTGEFDEVSYQSLQPDIVKNEVRVADQQVMAPLLPFDVERTKQLDEREKTFPYVFDVRDLQGQQVTVHAVLHLRHLPPYFVRALDPWLRKLTDQSANVLLQQMEVDNLVGPDSEPVTVG